MLSLAHHSRARGSRRRVLKPPYFEKLKGRALPPDGWDTARGCRRWAAISVAAISVAADSRRRSAAPAPRTPGATRARRSYRVIGQPRRCCRLRARESAAGGAVRPWRRPAALREEG